MPTPTPRERERMDRHEQLADTYGEEKLELVVCLLRTAVAMQALVADCQARIAVALEVETVDVTEMVEEAFTGAPDNGHIDIAYAEEVIVNHV